MKKLVVILAGVMMMTGCTDPMHTGEEMMDSAEATAEQYAAVGAAFNDIRTTSDVVCKVQRENTRLSNGKPVPKEYIELFRSSVDAYNILMQSLKDSEIMGFPWVIDITGMDMDNWCSVSEKILSLREDG